jgi:hypothetical protein
VSSRKNKCSVRKKSEQVVIITSNKILIAGTTYYHSENKFTSHLEQQKNINGGKIFESKEYKNGNRKNKVESKKKKEIKAK